MMIAPWRISATGAPVSDCLLPTWPGTSHFELAAWNPMDIHLNWWKQLANAQRTSSMITTSAYDDLSLAGLFTTSGEWCYTAVSPFRPFRLQAPDRIRQRSSESVNFVLAYLVSH